MLNSFQMLRSINSPVAILAITVVMLCGCEVNTTLRPMPVIYGPAGLDLCSIIPESRRTSYVQVFYATDRKPKGPADQRTYENDVDTSVHLGVANVQMQLDKKAASWDDICRAAGDEKIDPIFSLRKSSDVSDPAAFYDAINQQLALTPNREVNIYVHGFFTKFEVAVETLGKMMHCSGRRGVMVCFSWPARQSMLLYASDIERGRASGPYLADLIEQLAANTNAENINILSYSVGAVCATNGLLELRKRHAGLTPEQLAKKFRIGNIIYAASDIDLESFAREQIIELKQLCKHVIIYLSADDSVLQLASLARGATRLGHPDLAKFTREEQEAVAKDPQIQVVDVSDVPGPQGFGGFGGHYYWYSNDWVMTDILVSLRWQISPDQRGLYRKPGQSRWYFPPDYPAKVTAAVKHLTMPTTAPASDRSAMASD